MEIPGDWTVRLSEPAGRFHVRYERDGLMLEVRALTLNGEDLITALENLENLVFPDFLRSELIPYSAETVTGFRGFYEDNDPINPYSLHVFFTSAGEKLYVLSIAYPKRMEKETEPFVDRIFSSFRM
jgi:hypothetical protein